MNQYLVFCCIFIASFEGIICPRQGFNIDIPTLDVTTIYETVNCLGTSVKRAMFEFEKNEECYDVYDQVGFSPKPDAEYIYLSTKDIREKSSSNNIVKFRANNKSYVVKFEDASQANYFMEYKEFDSGFNCLEAKETIRYTNLKLTSFENEEEELYLQFETDRSKIDVKVTDVKVSQTDSVNHLNVTLSKNNGLKRYKIIFASKADKDRLLEFF